VRNFSSHKRGRGSTVLENERELEKHDQDEGDGFAAANEYLEGERDAREGIAYAKDQGNHVGKGPRMEADIRIHFVVKELALDVTQLIHVAVTVYLHVIIKYNLLVHILTFLTNKLVLKQTRKNAIVECRDY